MQISHSESTLLSSLRPFLCLSLTSFGMRNFSIKIQFEDPQCDGAGKKMLKFAENRRFYVLANSQMSSEHLTMYG